MSKPQEEYAQCALRSLDTGMLTTCWLNKPSRFKVGSVVTLRGRGGEKWEVMLKYSGRKPKSELNTDWSVGGL